MLSITALHLAFLPWALGTMHPWSQLTSLGLAVAGFAVASLPRARQWSAARLWRAPVWWAALALLGYIVVQGLNPAWRFQSNADSWWLEALPHMDWLPSSVSAPFARTNPWRALTVLASLALLVGSVWIGFTRRRSYHALFALLAVNACLLSLFGLVQQMTGARRIFWSYVSSNDGFAASFIYPNHAGPYLYLMAALATGLAWWHDQRARNGIENPGPAAALVACALFCSVMVIFSASRVSILLLLVFMLAVGGRLLLRLALRKGPVRDRPEFGPVILLFLGWIGLGLLAFQSDRVADRVVGALVDPSAAIRDRALARQAAGDMLHDCWLLGWGAGCFEYGFPKYTKPFPEVHSLANGARRSWEHAHDELLEFPIELGAVGLVPLAVVLGSATWHLGRRRFWRNVVPFCLVVGCALVLVHASVDFVFHSPAILLTWGVLLAGALRWMELDQPGGSAAA